MQALLSPQSNSLKPDLFTKCRSPSLRNQRSPSGRNQRIPSMQEHLCHSNHILKSSKQQSPSKISQQIRRRRSQLMQNNQLSSSNTKKKQKSVVNSSTNAQNIMSSIQDLKQEYRILKQAYKELIQQKMKHQEEIIQTKMENNSLKHKIEQNKQKQDQYKLEINELKQQLSTTRLQLEKEKRSNRDLQNDLYFFRETDKSKTDLLAVSSNSKMLEVQPFASDRFKFTDSEDIFPDNNVIEEVDSNAANDSHLLSFSLTSVIDQSIRMQQFSRRRKQHIKVVSDLSQGLNDHFGNIEVKGKKDCMASFKKNKKQSKLDLTNESKHNLINESKQNISNPLAQLLNLKSPVSNDKKNLKLVTNNSTSRRRREEKQNMIELPKNMKKKSKKILQVGGNQ